MARGMNEKQCLDWVKRINVSLPAATDPNADVPEVP